LLGQGVHPADHHPLADGPSEDELRQQLDQLADLKARPLDKLPIHDAFLASQVGQAA
ncbi:MAG: hypothetical protein RIS94_1311, partial [Pseudomonadota bacterium]